MITEFVCPNGHCWDITVDSELGGDNSLQVCPICGQPCPDPENGSKTVLHRPLAPATECALTGEGEGKDKNLAPATAFPLPGEEAGRVRKQMPMVSGYALLGLLGQGGMATVYKARHLRLDRLVALKMIFVEHDSPRHRMRFQLEGEALAKLNHPNIIKIFEVGECNGTPFISLEYQEGGSLDKRLAGLPQSAASAAQMIETLARAIHHAHQQGIVHRDLKPGNIMLGKDGQPKIGDFGMAKLLEKECKNTRTGDILGTPGYMAPEQALGDTGAIGPLADVYALGVILYEMLTGRPPFRGGNAVETLKMIIAKEPVLPRQLQADVPRDLETICLKCLEKAPFKRYASAEALAEDLRRFQTHQPIQARRAGMRERLGKWMWRHPAQAALIGVILLALLSLGVLGAWSNARLRDLAEKANERSREAHSVVDDLYSQFAVEWLAEEPHKDPVQEKFLQKALEHYQKFAKEDRADSGVDRERALAHFRLGQIQRILNQHTDAQTSFHLAIALQEELCEKYPVDPQYRQDLGNSLNWLGELFRQMGKMAAAEDGFQKAIALQDALLAEVDDRDQAYRQELARSHYNLAIVLMDTGRPQLAGKNLEQAFSLLAGLHQEFPEVADYRHELARCFINQGALNRESGPAGQAGENYRKAIELLSPLAPTFPAKKESIKGPIRLAYRTDLALAHRNYGNLVFSQGLHAEAQREMTQALEIFKQLVVFYPNRPAYQKNLADTYNSLGSVAVGTGKDAEAEKYYAEARMLLEHLTLDYPEIAEYRGMLAIAIGNLGWVFSERQDWREAKRHMVLAIDHLKAALIANPHHPDCMRALANQYQSLAETAIRLGDHAAAASAAQELPGIYRDRAQDYYHGACFLSRCLPLTEKDPVLSDAGIRQACAQKYIDGAMSMLEMAVKMGPVKRLPSEKEIFQPLLHRPGIQKLLALLDGMAKP